MAYSDNFATTIKTAVDSLTSAEFATIDNMIVEKTFAKSDLSKINEIVTGLRNGSVMPIMKNVPQPDSFPFADASDCATTSCDVTNTYSEHKWELGLVECRLGICMKSFDEDFLTFYNAYKATQAAGADIDLNSLLLKFITDKFIDNLALATWRASYFGDKASGSSYYDQIDGIFVQLEAGSGTTITITQNAAADFATQMALTGVEVFGYLTDMYHTASNQAWFDATQVEFRITRSLASRLVAYLNTADMVKLGCTCIDPHTAVASPFAKVEGLHLFGIPVITVTEWDNIINYSTELNGGGGNAARVKPFRAILAPKYNLLVGTTERDSLNSFGIWYSKDDKKIYVEGSSYVGGGVPTDEYVLAI